jgi:phosphoglycerate dehydrogenase-like enzyme
MQGAAAGSAAATLNGMPAASGSPPAASPPPFPVTQVSYPLAEPGKGAALHHVKIVKRGGIPAATQDRILRYSPRVELKQCSSAEEFQREVEDAHVIFGEFSREDLPLAKQLKWIQWTAAGVENILWPELVNSPVVLTNMQRIFAPPISETVIGLLLSLTRGLNRYALEGQQHRWNIVPGPVEISGMTMGIVGLGGNGADTACRAYHGFNMRILAVDPKPLPKPDFVAELHSLDALPAMVPRCDVIVSAAPLTPVSEKMFNLAFFQSMKHDSYFINISRGKLVDTPALVRALNEGWIAGAGLDVTEPEPLPPDHPLWTAGNVLITCHSSGHAPKTSTRQNDLFAENVRRYMEGLPLLNVVDKIRGY